MRRGLLIALGVAAAVVAIALLPAVSVGGKHGKLVGKDRDKGKSAVAVALATVKKPGKLTMVVKARPRHRVAWIYTTRCEKDGRTFQYPPPGQAEDTISKTPIRKKLKTGGVKGADVCKVAVSAKLDYNSGKSVTAKIYNK